MVYFLIVYFIIRRGERKNNLLINIMRSWFKVILLIKFNFVFKYLDFIKEFFNNVLSEDRGGNLNIFKGRIKIL